jgi:hypothetical protein
MISEENKKNWQEYAQSLFDEVWVDYGLLIKPINVCFLLKTKIN